MFDSSFADIVNNGGRVPSPLDVLKRQLRVVLSVLLLAGGITGAVLWVWRETPGSCLILQERYCRSGVRLTAPNGRYGGVGFLLPSGTPVFAPAEGIVNTSGVLTLPSGTKYHTVFFNAPTGYQLVLVGNPLRNGKAGPAVPSSVMVRVTNGRLTEMGPYNLIVTSFPDGKKYDEEYLKEFL